MNNDNLVHPNECACLSWKPVFAGALVAVGLSFLLNLFSIAIGLTAFTTNSEGVETMALSGLLAAAIGIIASMFTSGWLAGYLGQRHCSKRHLGSLYGFLTWCVALILAVFLASHIQHYISFYGHFLSGSTEVIEVNNAASNNVSVAASNMPAKSLVVSTYILFVLFFLGAFAASLGGHCGMRHTCKKSGSCPV